MTEISESEHSSDADEQVRVVGLHHPGRLISGVIVLALLAWLIAAVASTKNFDYGAVGHYLFSGVILTGVLHTLYLTVLAMAIGLALGILTAVCRLSPNPVISSVAWAYVWLFRGTPVLVQLIFWFNLGVVFKHIALTIPFGGPTLFSTATNSLISPLTAALLGLGLNEGAYMSEIVRAGIISVDKGQTEAAQALGLTRLQTMRRVVLPQALRVIVPPTGNEVISMLKFTSLASVISYKEMLGTASDIYSTNLQILELLTVASIWYLICTSVLSVGQFFLEQRLSSGSGLARTETLAHRVALAALGRRTRMREGDGPKQGLARG